MANTDLTLNDLVGSIFGSDGSGRYIQFMNNLVSSVIWNELISYDITEQLSEIDIPIAVYAGKYDFVVPPIYALEIFEAIENSDNEYYLFETSDHSPMLTERHLFNSKVINFIELHK